MILLLVTMAIIATVAALSFAQPARPTAFVVWDDATERRMLRERNPGRGW